MKEQYRGEGAPSEPLKLFRRCHRLTKSSEALASTEIQGVHLHYNGDKDKETLQQKD
jgi:hypothetical protein